MTSAPRVTSARPEADELPLAVHAQGLVKRFGSFTAVDGIDLDVRQGEVVAFLGPNGAGKTTTIDMLLGLAQPDAGSVELFGRTPRTAISHGLVSAVMQTGGLLSDVTVRDTMRITASVFDTATSIDAAMDRAGIRDIAGRKVGQCSGGQKQRLRFAMALVSDPGLIVLDEPTTGMDVEGRHSFWQAIHADAERGRTVVFATHYLEEADRYADRIVVVRKGRIVADGTTAEIKALASGRTVEAEWGTPDVAALRAIPGVEDVQVQGTRIIVRSTDSDAVARHLLNHTDAHDVTVTSQNLEQAFLQLTGEGE